MCLTEDQRRVINAARSRMAGEAWFRGVCLDRLAEDAEIHRGGFLRAVDALVLDTMAWDCPAMWGGEPIRAAGVSTGQGGDALCFREAPQSREQRHPAPKMYPHSVIEARSLAMHLLIAEKVRQDPRLFDIALENVRRWKEASRSGCPQYLMAWEEILSQGMEHALGVATDPCERGARLRQSTPFAGVLRPKERWEFLRKWNEDNSST